jgi:hypothetical protein
MTLTNEIANHLIAKHGSKSEAIRVMINFITENSLPWSMLLGTRGEQRATALDIVAAILSQMTDNNIHYAIREWKIKGIIE